MQLREFSMNEDILPPDMAFPTYDAAASYDPNYEYIDDSTYIPGYEINMSMPTAGNSTGSGTPNGVPQANGGFMDWTNFFKSTITTAGQIALAREKTEAAQAATRPAIPVPSARLLTLSNQTPGTAGTFNISPMTWAIGALLVGGAAMLALRR